MLLLFTVGYAAFSTTLNIGAKGNVVEKPRAEIGGQEVEIVTSGDGLYEDEYEEERYIYKGTNPNNYITFSGETWRIISVESDGSIKIMRNESIGDRIWHHNGLSNDWAGPSLLNTYLNEEYFPTLLDSDKVISHTWNIGVVTDDNNDLAAQINDEKGTSWNGKVGLITVSEYIRANTNTEQCGTLSLNNDNYSTCKTTDWMVKNNFYWTISPVAGDSTGVFRITSEEIGTVPAVNTISSDVFPVLYLSSDITLNGAGELGDPFVIS